MRKMGWEGVGTRARWRRKKKSKWVGEWGAFPFCTSGKDFLWRMPPHAPQKVGILWRMWSHAPQNCLPPIICVDPTRFSVAHDHRCATEMRISVAHLNHAPQKGPQNSKTYDWWWGPQAICGVSLCMRHRIPAFCGACGTGAPQNVQTFCGAPPGVRHRIVFVAHGFLGAPQKGCL